MYMYACAYVCEELVRQLTQPVVAEHQRVCIYTHICIYKELVRLLAQPVVAEHQRVWWRASGVYISV